MNLQAYNPSPKTFKSD